MEGWDFSWFEGRATEERPPWGYARLMGERMARAEAALDIDTGGGEVLATVARPPALLVATEGWRPNVTVARRRLRPARRLGRRGDCDPDAAVRRRRVRPRGEPPSRCRRLGRRSRRVLQPGGIYLSQQIGPGTNRELTDFLMGPQPVNEGRSAASARAGAVSAGLDVVDLRECSLRVEFFDIGAVVHFLRKVHWTVPASRRRRTTPSSAVCTKGSSGTARSCPRPDGSSSSAAAG